MSNPAQPFIVGAGPVGLGAALFLAKAGHVPRVIEMHKEPSPHSKALAVNPRTLTILASTGVTQQMLALGSPIYGARFHRQGRVVAELSFQGIHPTYPFMLALSQATTERLLARALVDAGGTVERGVKLVACRSMADGVEATLEPTDGGSQEVVHCPWLLGADGAHSVARRQRNIPFVGSSFPEEWHLVDVPLRTSLSAEHAHIFFLEEGAFLFLLRVVDDTQQERPDVPLWRVLGNRPQPLTQLVQAEQAGSPIWASTFSVAHRIAETLASGGVYLAGDAAHIHSPVGARGMNLGLEDAWVFAQLCQARRLADYNDLRHPVDERVVQQVALLSKVAAAEAPLYSFLRRFVLPTAVSVPFIRARMLATVTGLDHALPSVAS